MVVNGLLGLLEKEKNERSDRFSMLNLIFDRDNYTKNPDL